MKGVIGALLICASAATGLAATAGTYDLVFRSGTLGGLPEASVIEYAQSGSAATETIRLTVAPDDRTELSRIRDGRTGTIGSFPTHVGNPLIMYFLEDAVRDLAELSGGSPFYIRNRFKEALLDDVPVEEVTVPYDGDAVTAARVVLHPLGGDGHAKAAGYDDVALEITVSDEVPGWYYALVATGGGAAEGYRSAIALTGAEEPER